MRSVLCCSMGLHQSHLSWSSGNWSCNLIQDSQTCPFDLNTQLEGEKTKREKYQFTLFVQTVLQPLWWSLHTPLDSLVDDQPCVYFYLELNVLSVTGTIWSTWWEVLTKYFLSQPPPTHNIHDNVKVLKKSLLQYWNWGKSSASVSKELLWYSWRSWAHFRFSCCSASCPGVFPSYTE